MEHCEVCGKLIQRGEGRCFSCRRQDGAAFEQPVEPPVDVKVARTTYDEDPYEDVPCVRCRKHLAIKDSEFCLACQLELLSVLGDAAHEIFQVAPPPPRPPIASSASLMTDLEEKRARTATSRIRVVGGAKLK